MLTKHELIERIIPSYYTALKDSERELVYNILMKTSDHVILELLAEKGFRFEKIGNWFISKN